MGLLAKTSYGIQKPSFNGAAELKAGNTQEEYHPRQGVFLVWSFYLYYASSSNNFYVVYHAGYELNYFLLGNDVT